MQKILLPAAFACLSALSTVAYASTVEVSMRASGSLAFIEDNPADDGGVLPSIAEFNVIESTDEGLAGRSFSSSAASVADWTNDSPEVLEAGGSALAPGGLSAQRLSFTRAWFITLDPGDTSFYNVKVNYRYSLRAISDITDSVGYDEFSLASASWSLVLERSDGSMSTIGERFVNADGTSERSASADGDFRVILGNNSRSAKIIQTLRVTGIASVRASPVDPPPPPPAVPLPAGAPLILSALGLLGLFRALRHRRDTA